MSSRQANSKKKSQVGQPSAPPARLSEPLQKCWELLEKFLNNAMLEAFTEPVDWEGFGLMDYPDIIKHPMDLGTIKEKLDSGKYTSVNQFESDMKLVFTNCMQYNRADSELYQTAEKALKTFERHIIKIKQSTKQQQRTTTKHAGSAEATRADRLKLSQCVTELSSEQLGQLIEIIQKECPEALNEEEDDEVEIEINNIDGHTLLQLVSFAESCVSQGTKKKQKV